jgi:hypothetical protein
MTDQLYRYSMKDMDKTIEITFLVPPETNVKKHLKIAIGKDTISVFDTRQAQPIILVCSPIKEFYTFVWFNYFYIRNVFLIS